MNNSRPNVYRGDFRKSAETCEFTHVSVFMRTRRADPRFAAYRIVPICGQEMPVHPTSWVCRLCVIWDHYTTVSFSLLGTPVFSHMRRVKYGFFKNRKKILRNKIVKSGLHTRIN